MACEKNFFFAKSCRGHCYDHFKPSVKSLGLMVRFAGKNVGNLLKTDFCPPARMPLRNQRFLRFTRYRSSCGALVRPSGKTEESLIPNNYSALLRWNYDFETILKRFPVVENPYVHVFRRFGDVLWGVLAIFTISTTKTEPNLTYIKLMLSQLVWPRELKHGLK